MPPGAPRGDLDRQVREEIQLHLEERAREFEAMGMSPREALEEARRAFGDVERIEAQVGRIRRSHGRDMGRWMMMEGIRQDLRLAVRGVLRRPGFAAVVVATLGLGIGAVTAVFSVVNAALLDSLPFAEADRLVFIQGAFDAPEGPQVRGASLPEFRDWREQSRSFDVMAAVDGGSAALSGSEGAPLRLQTELVGQGYFQALRIEPLLGRVFTPGEMRVPGGEAVAILGETLWDDRFGRDPGVIGRSITLNGAPFTVVGVLEDRDRGTSLGAQVWVPLAAPTLGVPPELAEQRGSRFLGVVARLAPGSDVETAQLELSSLATRLQQAYPESHEDRIALVSPMRQVYLGDTGTLVLLVLCASALLLLIAGANVANLLLVRSTGRGGEVVMKKALGASRGRLVSQFMTESMVLAGLGAALGLLLGAWGAKALVSAMPPALLPSYVDIGVDGKVFLVTVVIMGFVGLLSGVTPAVLTSGTNLADGLREAGRGSLSRSRARVQRAFVAAQIALALILTVGAALMTRSFEAQLAVDTGFDQDNLYVFRVSLPEESYPDGALRGAVADLESRLEALPLVTGVTYSSGAPLRGGYSAAYLFIEGREEGVRYYRQRIAPDWFETMGTQVPTGRALNSSDVENPEVTVISEALARRFFPGEDPVGRLIRVGRDLDMLVVGVAEDVRFRDLTTDLLAGDDDPDIYLPWDRFPTRTLDFVLRTGAEAGAMERAVRDVVSGFDPQVPVYRAQPLSETIAVQTSQGRFGSTLLTAFGALAMFLALVGLYGVLAYAVDQRRKEIALRMAVGAQAANVRALVVGQGMRLAAWGLIAGLGLAAVASRSLDRFLYGVESLDLTTYLLAALAMAGVAAAAAWVPALRATRVEPQGALKSE